MLRRFRGLPALLLTASLLAACTTSPSAGPPVAAPASPAASPSAAGCLWKPAPAGPSVKDVGTPPAALPSATGATMVLTTNLGAIEIALDPRATPCAVASFAFLAGKGFFDGTACHRLITELLFVLACGDPSGTGEGGPGYRYAEEHLGNDKGWLRGSVAVSHNDTRDANGSQFFVNYADNPELHHSYTPLGTVTKGMDLIDRVAAAGVTPGGTTPKLSLVVQHLTVVYS
ncbi:peptidylprolyl isomerase [Dactylosporangium sp. CS-047395]|uniref:peptidylprolyl isomerase n=1 Tax=Dactylosporangium sp. CS-047395 TaxID=3239936 RepID=UPI003D8E1858